MSGIPSSNHEQLPSDEALIKRLQKDDVQAFREIFRRYNLHLLKLAINVLRDADVAKDIVQEIFIDLWNRRHSSEIQLLSAYLNRATKFAVLKHLRRQGVQERHLKTARNVSFVNQTEEALNFKEMELALVELMAQLPERCREVFYLSRYEYLSNREIAERLNISPNTVEVHITKSLTFLRQKLAKLICTIPFLLILLGRL